MSDSRPPPLKPCALAEQAPMPPAGNEREWFEQLYHELRRRARGELFRHEALSLGPSTLLHEAWMRMDARALNFSSQAELCSYAARVMRGIVIDHIRQRRSQRHGGEFHFVPLDSLVELKAMAEDDTLKLDEAIEALAAVKPDWAAIVELKFFGGLNFAEIAALRGVSERTVQRDWEKARIFLFDSMRSPR
ncbi:RNA polymerase subunit sigma [Paucibacter sp. KBW04]|uniref:ECF-type sigma factor n=1 Tax=Paucibacter sp. KBW04 TaxID=2153361 RepID=UPI000F56C497|nr:ECF-type sigma factor [Paucibacter sp. KBW04]RQO57948.1 RNA polymerase subunit sigma [Paucibacter sp. KBW04]